MAERRPQRDADARLAEYRRRRDFERTAEPRGGEPVPGGAELLFVVQKHAARRLHYDLRLELHGVLKSWALPKGPSLDTKQRPLAVHVEDHPMEYAEFEGVIPEDEYGGGAVMVWDRGTWEPLGDPEAGYRCGDLKFNLRGEKLRGAWALVRMGGAAGADGRNWLLIKKRDDAARSVRAYNVLAEAPLSVLSGRTLDEIARDPDAVWTGGAAQPTGRRRRPKPAARSGPDPGAVPGARRAALPATLRPQLATLVDRPPEGDEWLHEIKLDGYRLLCRLEGGTARLLTRNGHDWTERMPDVARDAARLPVESAFLDGEVVVLDAAGISDFQALQNAFRGRGRARLTCFLFDAPFAGGFDLRQSPLLARKTYLEALLEGAGPALHYCDHIRGRGPVVFEQAARGGLEGIVSKRVDCHYVSRRADSWRKVKCTQRRDFVVGGFTRPTRREGFGALLLGRRDEQGRLVYRGRVGTGFDDATLRRLGDELRGLARNEPPFVNPEADPQPREVVWVEPRLVADVEFGAWTGDGLVRHATFRGLRRDADPQRVGREAKPARGSGAPPASIVRKPSAPEDAWVAGVRVSHPRRTVYPDDGITKLQVAEYYAAVAGHALPHLRGRPLSLVRCPLGLAGESFYQRELGEGFPDPLRGITVSGNGSEDHAIVVDDAAGLVALAQMGALEIHAWGCREDDPRRPDRLVLDLDPGPGITWEDVVASARFLRKYLADLGLESFVKTTGGRGLHVVAPLVRRRDWAEVKRFARAVARDLARIAPRNFVATMSRERRDRRIYIDFLRNQPGATAVAPYSTRARNGAPVSTPLRWGELSADVPPPSYSLKTVPQRLARLRRDPWEGFGDLRQSITSEMLRAVDAE